MTQPKSMRLTAHAAAWSASLALAGCFGGSSDSPVPPVVAMPGPLEAVPATATATISGLFSYQASVNSEPQAKQDMAEPIDISALSLPTSETSEPTDLG